MRELEFFGQVTAGVTHQIKNELAVLNETGGLIAELITMAELGREVDPGRIKTLAERVVDRVGRSNLMIKRLNKFAHSTEQETTRTDLYQSLELVAGFFQRNAEFKKVSLALDPWPGDSPLEVKVRPFLLTQILWAAFETAVGAARPGSQITVAFTRTEDGIFLKFWGELTEELILPPDELLVQGETTGSVEGGAICLRLPS